MQFFSLGSLEGRTLVVYMKKKGIVRRLFALPPPPLQVGRSHAWISAVSVFHVLEPISGSINEGETDLVSDTSRSSQRQLSSECFRVYCVRLYLPELPNGVLIFNIIQRDLYRPAEAYDVIFLSTKIAILGKKGF